MKQWHTGNQYFNIMNNVSTIIYMIHMIAYNKIVCVLMAACVCVNCSVCL